MGRYNYGKTIMKIYKADENSNKNVESIKKNGVYEEYLTCISIMEARKLFEVEFKKSFSITDVNDLISVC